MREVVVADSVAGGSSPAGDKIGEANLRTRPPRIGGVRALRDKFFSVHSPYENYEKAPAQADEGPMSESGS